MLNPPRRHFLSWDRPLLPQAVGFLTGGWAGTGPLDLSRLLVVVPTRQSGRRLREALAEFASNRGSAAFPPVVVTPEALVALARQADAAGGPPIASKLEALLAWIEVLRAVDLGEFRDVFPVDPPARTFAWAARLAEQFARLQATLSENDLRIADVATAPGGDFPEAVRWRQLGALEERHTARLADAGVRPAVVRRSRRSGAAWLDAIDRIVVLATADPLPSAVRVLAEDVAPRPVDVVVFAPAEQAGAFDEWGRPVAEQWSRRTLVLPDFERRVHVCADPVDQGARVAALAAEYAASAGDGGTGARSAEGKLGVGIADPEILPLLEAESNRAGVAVFNPEGEARRSGALYHLLYALAACAVRPTFEAVEALVRCPDFLRHLARRAGAELSAAAILQGMDDLRRQHLPADLAAARAHAKPELARVLELIAALHEALGRGTFPENVASVMAEVYGGRVLNLADDADARLHDAASAWTEIARECAAVAARFDTVTDAEWWELALRMFGDSRRADDKPAGAVELQGWLELLFEDAPHLVVAGLNDGLVPEAVTEDPFLPESLRARIGLRTNAARFARDAYLLQAMIAGRGPAGRVDVLLGKTSAAGDPLRPSRLLLRCPDAELPDRIDFLFRSAAPVESHLPWRRAWRLRPRLVPPPAKVAVTSLRRWLTCPFRFYLQYALRMEAVDAAKSEMDAFDFGSLCHLALEAMGRDAAMRDCTDGGVLREFLLAQLNHHAREKFGDELSLPLLIQLESARQRLAKLAEVQAQQRAEGWVIQRVEQPFEVPLGGLVVKGKIDRIDRHRDTGAVRVLDYKTSDTAVNPRAAHIRPLREAESPPEWARVNVDGKVRVWADLQLPLYRHALAAEWGGDIASGYLNLPKAVGQTALAWWDDYSLELQEQAMRCAEGVCAAIARGEFWPPNEDPRNTTDDFAPLFHHGVADSVAWPAAPAGTTAEVRR